MSLKGVELQIAIPKTVDAGKMAEQHQQNVVQQQFHANEALKRDIEKKQLTVNDTEKISGVSERDKEKEGSGKESNHNQKGRKKHQEQVEAKHPYKGNFIDFSG
ncbi:RNA polymerase subunit sigma [Ureibacillus thermophilus]|uniref:RNA polymerase subunit sigma n=1 Tax=Ureibacillus thermophilus TaxID=367743 RepID=A0A4P6UUT6_9BACL|nr:RNA polymerase subunit sigma [Ureibacillus thermophilus]QBK25658.1 RNA polymerase subunit sigma [Ureibacillus thermophilus]